MLLWSIGRGGERGGQGGENVVMEQREGVKRGLSTEDEVMGQREEIREGNKAMVIWLWDIGMGIERGTRHWKCGYGAKGDD